MRRALNNSASRGYFTKTAMYTKSINLFTSPMRGGYRM